MIFSTPTNQKQLLQARIYKNTSFVVKIKTILKTLIIVFKIDFAKSQSNKKPCNPQIIVNYSHQPTKNEHYKPEKFKMYLFFEIKNKTTQPQERPKIN